MTTRPRSRFEDEMDTPHAPEGRDRGERRRQARRHARRPATEEGPRRRPRYVDDFDWNDEVGDGDDESVDDDASADPWGASGDWNGDADDWGDDPVERPGRDDYDIRHAVDDEDRYDD